MKKKIAAAILALAFVFLANPALADDSLWKSAHSYEEFNSTNCVPLTNGAGSYVRAYVGNGVVGTDRYGNLSLLIQRRDGTYASKTWYNTEGSYITQHDTSRFWYLPIDTAWDDIIWVRISESGFDNSFQIRFITGCYY